MQRTCPGVQNEIFTGFVANFYAASVVIRAGTLLGVPEEDGRVIRSLSCLGVKGNEKVCRHCHALSTTISKVMHDHGQRDSLAPISDFQRESLKEERHERQQRQMIPLTDKVFWPANIYTTQVMTTDKPPQLNTDWQRGPPAGQQPHRGAQQGPPHCQVIFVPLPSSAGGSEDSPALLHARA